MEEKMFIHRTVQSVEKQVTFFFVQYFNVRNDIMREEVCDFLETYPR